MMISPFNWKPLVYIVGGVVILVTIGWVANSFPRQSVVDSILKDREEQIKVEYIEKIAARDRDLAKLQEQYKISETKLNVLNNELKTLKKRYADIKPPKTPEELRKALSDLGYPPL